MIREAIRFGLETVQTHRRVFIAIEAVAAGLVAVLGAGLWMSQRLLLPFAPGVFLAIAGAAILFLALAALLFSLVETHIALRLHDKQAPALENWGSLFKKMGRFVRGTPAALSPSGWFVPHLIVDRDASVSAARAESRRIWRSNAALCQSAIRWFLLLNLAGCACFLVGLFVTLPTTLLAVTYLYRRV